MNNQITMVRPATLETESMAKARMKALSEFRKEIKELGFRKLSTEEIQKNNKRLGLAFPDRVNEETHEQDQYIYEHRNGYQVVVITSILDDYFMDKGRVWVHITQDQHRLWSRYFLKTGGYASVFEKLLAYAEFARNIVIARPQCPKTDIWMDLYEKRTSFTFRGEIKTRFVHVWISDHAEYPFTEFWKLYTKDISKERLKIILNKEFEMQRYFKERTAKKFARDIRKKANVTKPENSVAKR